MLFGGSNVCLDPGGNRGCYIALQDENIAHLSVVILGPNMPVR